MDKNKGTNIEAEDIAYAKSDLATLKLYDFMDNEYFNSLEYAEQYVDYFMQVKQDLMIKLDGVDWSIINTQKKILSKEAEILLSGFDFKAEYGKDNEAIRKAHIRQETGHYQDILADYKHKKRVLEHKLIAVDDLIESNLLVIANNDCHCEV